MAEDNRRFGLRTLLLSIAGLACVLGLVTYAFNQGKRIGYESGFNAAIQQRLTEEDLLKVTYPIDDAIAKEYPNDDVDTAAAQLTKTIRERIKPETWDLVGGYGVIEAVKTEYDEMTIVVENSIPVHIEVSRYLDDLRGAALGIRDRSLVKKLYEAQAAASESESEWTDSEMDQQ